MIDLEEFRSRWFRWLGQKTRYDRVTWVELLDCNWSGWANKINDRLVQVKYPSITLKSTRSDVYYCFQDAIAEATMEELVQLDNLFCTDLIRRKGW